MITSPAQRLRVLPLEFTVEHLPSGQPAADSSWWAMVRAPEGLTVVREAPPETAAGEGGPGPRERWTGLYGDTAHGLDVPGMLAAVIGPLAATGVPVFVHSTFHSDLVLVPRARRADAFAALRAAGHEVDDELSGESPTA
ncbi:ACT domain-containing protein [Streptomyces decoyicus]|uniref:ACT domain-containing protein n=1 Tax=Streptomyces decoyicus TaxID=249567 RepID=UPI002E17E3A3|nr:ACT domain-containing protein [Streptomyces decoyicus]